MPEHTLPADALHQAAEAGDLDKVKELISQGSDINALHSFNKTKPICWAAHKGHATVVEYLLKQPEISLDFSASIIYTKTSCFGFALENKQVAVINLLLYPIISLRHAYAKPSASFIQKVQAMICSFELARHDLQKNDEVTFQFYWQKILSLISDIACDKTTNHQKVKFHLEELINYQLNELEIVFSKTSKWPKFVNCYQQVIDCYALEDQSIRNAFYSKIIKALLYKPKELHKAREFISDIETNSLKWERWLLAMALLRQAINEYEQVKALGSLKKTNYEALFGKDSAFEHKNVKKFGPAKTFGSDLLFSACHEKKSAMAIELINLNVDLSMISENYGGSCHTIHIAARNGLTAVIKAMIDKGANINQRSIGGYLVYSPLTEACNEKQIETALKLIEWGADVNQELEFGTPICYAARNGLTPVIKALLDKGVDVNTSWRHDRRTGTPLSEACKNRHTEATVKLIECGADINRSCDDGRYPLHIAAANELLPVIEALFVHGANVNQVEHSSGDTALLLACDKKHTEAVALLINLGAQLDQPNKKGSFPLYVAVKNNAIDIVKLLLKAGAYINQSCTGTTPFMLAANLGHLEIELLLIEFNADVKLISHHDTFPLYEAVKNNDAGIARQLIEAGADINQSYEGTTPLMLAAELGYLEIAQLLIAFNADVRLTNTYGRTALHIAASCGQLDIVKLLFKQKAYLSWYGRDVINNNTALQITPLSEAIEYFQADVVKYLLSAEAEVQQAFQANQRHFQPLLKQSLIRNVQDIDFQICSIHLLASSVWRKGTKPSLEFFSQPLEALTNNGAAINEVSLDHHQVSLLHLLYADAEISNECIANVIELGGNIYQLDAYKNSPLGYYYINFGLPPITHIEFLLNMGVDVESALVWNKKIPIRRRPPRVNKEEDKIKVENQHNIFLKYFPIHYLKFCRQKPISADNHAGLIGHEFHEKDVAQYKQLTYKPLAFGLKPAKYEFRDKKKFEDFMQLVIVYPEQLCTCELTPPLSCLYARVLAACLIAEPCYISDELRQTIMDGFRILIHRGIAEKNLTTEHLLAIKIVLEHTEFLTQSNMSVTKQLYFRAYRFLYHQLPPLKFLAVESLLADREEIVKTELAAMGICVIEDVYKKEYPIKTTKLQSNFHYLCYWFKSIETQNSSDKKRKRDDDLENENQSAEMPLAKRKHSDDVVSVEGSQQISHVEEESPSITITPLAK